MWVARRSANGYITSFIYGAEHEQAQRNKQKVEMEMKITQTFSKINNFIKTKAMPFHKFGILIIFVVKFFIIFHFNTVSKLGFYTS
jgi:hypothetical protein